MRLLTLAVAACLLGACARARPHPSPAPISRPAVACAPAEGPLLVVDDAVQEPGCGKTNQESATECKAGAPLYVVDGVRTCVRP
jgi:hypothetical protein